MKTLKTMICLILDRSGSMAGKESDVIGGVNTFLAEQRKVEQPCSIAFVRFDNQAIERFRPMMPLEQCMNLRPDEYQPRGGTPLLDAVGQTIQELDNEWWKEKADRAIVVIATDGLENASTKFTRPQIKQMIEARQSSERWAFIFLGAGIDAFAEAGSMGIWLSNTMAVNNDAAGHASSYATASAAVAHVRNTGSTVAENMGTDQRTSK